MRNRWRRRRRRRRRWRWRWRRRAPEHRAGRRTGGGPTTLPTFVPGGGGGDGLTGGGGGAVDNPVVHRQLARLLGTDFAARPDLIADAVQCGLQQQSGTAGGITFAPIGPKWCAWTSPRGVNYKDDRNGVKFAGTLRDVAFGL